MNNASTIPVQHEQKKTTTFEKIKNRLPSLFSHAMLLIFICLFLELGVKFDFLSSLFFPRPSLMYIEFTESLMSGELTSDVLITLSETLIGFIIGCCSGILLALFLSRIRLIARFIDPYMVILYSTPSVVIAPLLVLFFGIGMESKIVLIVVHAFLLLYISVYGSAAQVDEDLVNAARVMGAKKREIFWKIIFPSTAPAIHSGLKLGIGVALIGAIVGEFIGAKAGIGYRILYHSSMMNVSGMFVGILLIAILAFILNFLVNQLGKVLVRYKYYDFKGKSNQT